ncbi:hypothetical protein ACHMW6_06410 [Pseudoduganella sp. UC29_106]|uniref:hypothetical protein n=1 Tax=Pseudoduganella sp. UC29_106 TaxID=3374553 RepID=UPI0037583AA0
MNVDPAYKPMFWSMQMEKQVGDRLDIVMTDPDLLKVYQRFGGGVFRRSSVFHGLGRMLAANDVRGKVCFEVGTWNALTSIVLSKHFDKVVTVDIAHNDIKRDIIKYLGITNIECIDIADNAEKAKIAKVTEFDFAYLDGDHANDTYTDFELVKHCGRALFHEVWPFQEPVWNLVHSLPLGQVVHGGFGLALWDSTKG